MTLEGQPRHCAAFPDGCDLRPATGARGAMLSAWPWCSMRAALIYQHRTAQRDKMVAAAISERVVAELSDIARPSGT